MDENDQVPADTDEQSYRDLFVVDASLLLGSLVGLGAPGYTLLVE